MDDHKEQQTQQHIDHELTRAVDKLGDAFHLIKDVFSDNQKRYESLAHEIRQDQEKEGRRQRRDAWLIAMISIVGIGSSVIAASYWSYKQEQVALQKTQIAALYSEKSMLERKINDRFERRDKLIDAMTAVRGIRDIGQKQCKDGVYVGNDHFAYQQKLFSTSYALTAAAYKMTGVFGDEVNNEIILFEKAADIDKVSICSKNASTDKDLRALETKANLLILGSIAGLEKEKELINTQILNVESGKK